MNYSTAMVQLPLLCEPGTEKIVGITVMDHVIIGREAAQVGDQPARPPYLSASMPPPSANPGSPLAVATVLLEIWRSRTPGQVAATNPPR